MRRRHITKRSTCGGCPSSRVWNMSSMIWFVRAARVPQRRKERTDGRGKRHVQSLRGVGKCFCTSAGLGQVANGCNGRISQEGRDRDRAVNLGRKAVQVVKYSIQYRKDVKENSWRGLHLATLTQLHAQPPRPVPGNTRYSRTTSATSYTSAV